MWAYCTGFYTLQEQVPFTTLDDAFDAMLQFMTITSRKCRVRRVKVEILEYQFGVVFF